MRHNGVVARVLRCVDLWTVIASFCEYEALCATRACDRDLYQNASVQRRWRAHNTARVLLRSLRIDLCDVRSSCSMLRSMVHHHPPRAVKLWGIMEGVVSHPRHRRQPRHGAFRRPMRCVTPTAWSRHDLQHVLQGSLRRQYAWKHSSRRRMEQVECARMQLHMAHEAFRVPLMHMSLYRRDAFTALALIY